MEPTYVEDETRVAFPANERVRELYRRANAGNLQLKALLGESYDPGRYGLEDHVLVDRPGGRFEKVAHKGNIQLGRATREALGDTSKRAKLTSVLVAAVKLNTAGDKFIVDEAESEEQSKAKLRAMEGSPEFFGDLVEATRQKVAQAYAAGHGFAGANLFVWQRIMQDQESQVTLTFVPSSGFVDRDNRGAMPLDKHQVELEKSKESFKNGAIEFLGEISRIRAEKEGERAEAFERFVRTMPAHLRDSATNRGLMDGLRRTATPSLVEPVNLDGRPLSEVAGRPFSPARTELSGERAMSEMSAELRSVSELSAANQPVELESTDWRSPDRPAPNPYLSPNPVGGRASGMSSSRTLPVHGASAGAGRGQAGGPSTPSNTPGRAR